MRLRSGDLVVQHLDGEVLMLCLASSTYFSTNGTGAVLVDRLASGADRRVLTDLLVERYGLSDTAARADVDAFLTQLCEHGLLVDD